MFLPVDRIQIGPHVVTVDSSAGAARLLRDEGNTGDSRPDYLLIRVDTDRPYTCVADTLLHEVMHVIWNRQTSLSVGEAGISGDDEERVVTSLATHLLDVLRRNPQLVAFLVGE